MKKKREVGERWDLSKKWSWNPALLGDRSTILAAWEAIPYCGWCYYCYFGRYAYHFASEGQEKNGSRD